MSQQREYTAAPSPPRTPPAQTSIYRPSKQKFQRPSIRDTFPDTIDNGTSTSESGDDRDPHDLSLSPQHAVRTSIVDNMLLSLDQFDAPGSSPLDDYRMFNPALDSDTHTRYSKESTPPGRFRGHTFSSSMSSEADYAYDDHRYATRTTKGRRSNSSSKYQTTPRKMGSTRGRDSMSARGVPANIPRSSDARKGSKGSSTSTVEYPSNIPRTRADSGLDRRSESFDCGPKRTYVPYAEPDAGQDSLFYDDSDAAPTPSVPGGPRKYTDYSRTPTNSRTPVGSRRNSAKSVAQAPQVRKTRTDNIGTGTLRARDNENSQPDVEVEMPPPMPASQEPAPSPTISYNKPSHLPPEPAPTNSTTTVASTNTPTKERPGFFRRVFGGSSKTPSPSAGEQGSPSANDLSYLRENEPKDAHGVTTNLKGRQQQQLPPKTPTAEASPSTRKGPQQVVKQKSSFFRRRKKSVVENVPPPIVLPQEIATPQALDMMKPEPSPVSSLRRVMDPYLADANPAHQASKEQRREGPQAQDSLSLQTQRETVSDSAEGSTIKIVPQDSEAETATESASLDNPRDATPSASLSPVVEDYSLNATSPTNHSADDLPKETPVEVNKLAIPATGKDIKAPESPGASVSEASQYQTAVNTPVVESEEPTAAEQPKDTTDGPGDAVEDDPTAIDREQAQKLFDSQDQVVGNEPAAAWLGDPDRAKVREAYMRFFNWSNVNILAALRSLCERLVLKGETQQVDRVLDAFSNRWCDCNPSHGFKATDVVHTICYSLLLLNTDLHLADIDQKMTKSQFVRNTMPTIHRVAMDAAPEGFDTLRPVNRTKTTPQSLDATPTSARSATFPLGDGSHGSLDVDSVRGPVDASNDTGPLVSVPFTGTVRAWEQQVESVLKEFYNSIQKERLPLYGAQPEREVSRMHSNNFLGPSMGTLRRSPSTISKSGSDIYPRGRSADSRHGAARWSSKPRSRAGRLYPPSFMGSSRTSLDDQSSLWSPTASSTWSKYSLGRFTSASVDSFGSEYPRGEYQQSIGFANALSQAIIREDSATSVYSYEDNERTMPLLEDETLALAGAPWAKEGSLKHKHHLDAVDKRAKDRNWNECFAVIQQGWMRLFSFNSKSMRQKAKQRGGVVVGGGNWTENAEELWKFMLRQTIASALPPPGYSKSRPHVWALSLPTGAVHLFQAGTPDIVREFVSTANYWSARLSKEPLVGGISNIEYGWSDNVINTALVNPEGRSPPPGSGPRPSIQSSIRSSIDQQSVRPRLPADRVHISDWSPPQQSMVASNLTEEDQLKALQTYVKNIEDELQRHNELRSAMNLAFSPRHPNSTKAMTNWEKKSSYLLREIVKFRTYMDSLRNAVTSKEKFYATSNNYYNGAGVDSDAVSIKRPVTGAGPA
ncbi:uncharacterized protein PFLUO_LOCUS808 [Penicillium psychrofluorescens]|uniref:uncharacterized protein n=1 Tax=Penicillium psychrofluorescens TaxID=3158075 RepID=UPI003CCDF154